MKKLSTDVKFEIAVQIAELFDIDSTGMDQETLVNSVNEKIDALLAAKPAKAGKWFEVETPAYNQGDMVDAVTGWAEGRTLQIEKPSAKKDAYKAFLINPKDGKPQGTLVTVEANDIRPYTPKVVEEVKEEVQDENKKEEEVVA